MLGRCCIAVMIFAQIVRSPRPDGDPIDSAMVLGHAVKEKGSRASDVQAYLSGVTNYPGVTGPIAVGKTGDAQVAWGMGVYKSGKLVPISERK